MHVVKDQLAIGIAIAGSYRYNRLGIGKEGLKYKHAHKADYIGISIAD